eukprot:TRINITY_DN5358_c0_g1_i1.p1 TRINITY_DN5358_c0_g1~~TRINITY_DN5358_c0_g1_i1.p1  ORF type:complete len:352 (+),score=23.69 TRINITY_DN5358_c0_g1_i1:149-1057(+)
MKLGDQIPNFKAQVSPDGRTIDFHNEIGDDWAILFSHPADHTPVCTTELGTVARYGEEFANRGCKLFALSCDSVESHKNWIADVEAAGWSKGKKVEYPIIADPKREVATTFGMLDPEEKDKAGMPMTCRAVFIIHKKALKLQILYPATTGRNFDELLRVIDSLQLTMNHSVATPVNWSKGSKCMVVPSISNEAAKEKFGGFETLSVPSNKEYIRMVPDPSKPNMLPVRLRQAFHFVGGPLALFAVGLLLGRKQQKNQAGSLISHHQFWTIISGSAYLFLPLAQAPMSTQSILTDVPVFRGAC